MVIDTLLHLNKISNCLKPKHESWLCSLYLSISQIIAREYGEPQTNAQRVRPTAAEVTVVLKNYDHATPALKQLKQQ